MSNDGVEGDEGNFLWTAVWRLAVVGAEELLPASKIVLDQVCD